MWFVLGVDLNKFIKRVAVKANSSGGDSSAIFDIFNVGVLKIGRAVFKNSGDLFYQAMLFGIEWIRQLCVSNRVHPTKGKKEKKMQQIHSHIGCLLGGDYTAFLVIKQRNFFSMK